MPKGLGFKDENAKNDKHAVVTRMQGAAAIA